MPIIQKGVGRSHFVYIPHELRMVIGWKKGTRVVFSINPHKTKSLVVEEVEVKSEA